MTKEYTREEVLKLASVESDDPNALEFSTADEANEFMDAVLQNLAVVVENKLAGFTKCKPSSNGTMDLTVVFAPVIAHTSIRIFQQRIIEAYAKGVLESLTEDNFSADTEGNPNYLNSDESVSVCYQILVQKVFPKTNGNAVVQEDFGKSLGTFAFLGGPYVLLRSGVVGIAGMDLTLTDDAQAWFVKELTAGRARVKNRSDVKKFTETGNKNIPYIYQGKLVWFCWVDKADERTVVVSDDYTGRYVDSDASRFSVSIDELIPFDILPELPMDKESIEAAAAEQFAASKLNIDQLVEARKQIEADEAKEKAKASDAESCGCGECDFGDDPDDEKGEAREDE